MSTVMTKGVSVDVPRASGRMSLANVTRGKQERPVKMVVYGEPGVGKTSLAARARKPIFLTSEDGTSQLDVARFPLVLSWEECGQGIRALLRDEHDFETLVVDTADGLEPLCWRAVAIAHGKAHIEDVPYGKGHVFAVELWRAFLASLDMLVRVRKMTIIVLCHSQVTRVDDVQHGTFERFSMKLHRKVVDAFSEWADAVLLARHEISVLERRGRGRAMMSGARLLFTQNSGAHFAKNRFNLPPEMPLDWDELEAAIRAHLPVDIEMLKARLHELIPRLKEPEKAERVLCEWAGENPVRLTQLLNKVEAKILLSAAEER